MDQKILRKDVDLLAGRLCSRRERYDRLSCSQQPESTDLDLLECLHGLSAGSGFGYGGGTMYGGHHNGLGLIGDRSP